jgi:hypothetical protein
MKYKSCQHCKKLISCSNILRHETACYKIANKPTVAYICKWCNKQLTSSNGLHGHIRIAHTERSEFSEYSKKGLSVIAKLPPRKHSIEAKERLSIQAIARLSKVKFYSKRTVYNGITLDSSYELTLAKSLDEYGIKWTRPDKGLKYFDGTQHRHYLPDFHLTDFNVYLDTKNDFLIKKDALKIKLATEQNSVSVIVVDKNNLSWPAVNRMLVDNR